MTFKVEQVAAVACIGATIAFLFSALFAVPLLLTNDGPQHLINTHFSLEYTRNPDLHLAEDWVINEPLTDHGYRELYFALEPLLGWQRAHTTTVALIILIGAVCWCAAVLTLDRRRWPAAVLLIALSISWSFYIGLYPFLFSTGLCGAAFALFLHSDMTKKLFLFSLSILLLLQCHIHPFPPMIAGLTMAAACLARPDRIRALLVLALVGLPSACLVLLIRAHSGVSAPETVWEIDRNPIRAFVGRFVAGGDWLQAAAFLLVVGLAGFALRRRSSLRPLETGLLWMAVVVFALVPVVPDKWNGWELVGPRTAPLAVSLILVVAPLEQLQRAWRVALGVLVTIFSVAYLHHNENRQISVMEDYTPILQLTDENLPKRLRGDWTVDYIWTGIEPSSYGIENYGPIVHLNQILALTRGGRPDFTQSNDRALHALWRPRRAQQKLTLPLQGLGLYRGFWDDSLLFDAEHRRRALVSYLARNLPLDHYFMVGLPSDEQALWDAGYEVRVLARDPIGRTLYQASFVGCVVEFQVNGVGEAVVATGIRPIPSPAEFLVVGAGGGDDVREGYPCGEYWVLSDPPCQEQLPQEVLPPGGMVVCTRP